MHVPTQLPQRSDCLPDPQRYMTSSASSVQIPWHLGHVAATLCHRSTRALLVQLADDSWHLRSYETPGQNLSYIRILASLRKVTSHYLIVSVAFVNSTESPLYLAMISASAISSLPIRSTTHPRLPAKVLHRVTSCATKSSGDHSEPPKAGSQGAPSPDDDHKATSNAPAEVVQPQGASGKVNVHWAAQCR